MLKWRIYYSDGSLFSDDDGRPEDAPGWGVVIIPQYGGGWWGHDLTGLLDCLAQPGPNIVVMGRTVASSTWREFLAKADKDSDITPAENRTLMHGWDYYCWHGSD